MKTKKVQEGIYLTWWQRLCYGLGQAGGGIMYTLGTTFLLIYYTNVVHIDAAIAGTIVAISKVLDGISDLVMGRLVDRTHSRFGKARPWLLRFCIPTMLCLILAFSVPIKISTALQIVYAFITYNLLSTVCYTAISVSYSSMNSLITTSQYERGINNILGMTFYTVALLVLNSTLQKLCAFFGGGDLYAQKGWTVTIVILAAVIGVCLMITFLFCREIKTEDAVHKEKAKNVNLLKVLKALVTNKYWREYVIGVVANTIGNGLVMGSAVYYAQYVLGDAYSYSKMSSALYIAMFIGVIATSAFIKKIGKRNTALIGLAILIVGTVMAGVIPKTVANSTLTMIIRGFGCGFPSALGTAMLQDTLTYGKWKSGFDMVGTGNAACSFTSKVGGGLGTALIGWLLKAGGFQSTQTVQSAGAQNMISAMFTWIPLVFVVITTVCFLLYRLDKEYAGYVKDLSEGRYGPDAVVERD